MVETVHDKADREESTSDNFNICELAETDVYLRKHFLHTPLFNAAQSTAILIEKLRDVERLHNPDHIQEINLQLSRLYRMLDRILNTGHYALVEDKYRVFFAYVCILCARFEFFRGNYFESLHKCDDGLMKGNDLASGWLSNFATYLCENFLPTPACVVERNTFSHYSLDAPGALPNSRPIPCVTVPSMAEFNATYFAKGRPLIIRGIVDGWPAIQKWSFAYLNERYGHRTVPVEIGRKYTDGDWCQKMMTFHEYLKDYVFTNVPEQKMGYLAQHRLSDQIPELMNDIFVPDYCAFAENGLAEDQLTVNMFIGPAGTVSPLHTDPRHNFFCQISGRKFVRLINPSFKQKLSLYEDMMRKNTSRIDVEMPDFEEFPHFRDVTCEDFVMEAGDCLFIPRGYFHHVRALQPSISVSIWFGL